MTRFAALARSLCRNLTRTTDLDAEMHDEIRLHLELEAERLVRDEGLAPAEARRRAFVAFGGVEKYKQAGRDARAGRWIEALVQDSRLGIRMLMKHRGLTLVGGFAMAVAIAIGATAFEALGELLLQELPYPNGARAVSIQVASLTGGIERRVVRDVADLSERLQTIEQIGAWRSVQHNLVSPYAPPEPIRLAEMNASGFVVTETPPLLGRYLLADDEREGAAPVVVIGHEAWQVRFEGDPQIVGRIINLGGVRHTIVGVMPAGFAFPFNHEFWISPRANPLQYERRQGPSLYMFGRLAKNVTLEQAQAELETAARHLSVIHPTTQDPLLPRVLPYPREHVDLSHPTLVRILRVGQLLVGVLSFVVAVNIAILLYARTVTRLGEIAVRTALGASRARLLAQLFTEALVLSALGAAAGLMLARAALGYLQSLARANATVPFWIRFELSLPTMLYVIVLTVMAAAIMGVLPGLKVTGRRFAATMHELSGRGGSRLGPIWTTLVVAQVAVAVAILPVAAYLSWQIVRMEASGPGFAAEQFMVAHMVIGDDTTVADENRVRSRQLELMSRLQNEPGVTAVTFSSAVPGFSGERRFEFDKSAEVADRGALDASVLDVSPDVFEIYSVDLLAGRALDARDTGKATAVVVNQTFADVFLAGRSPIGVRLRYLPRSDAAAVEPWHEIVGVVRDFPRFPPAMSIDGEPAIYHAAAVGELHPLVVSMRFAGSLPAGVTERIRTIGAEVDPAIQLRRLVPLSQFYDEVRSLWRYLSWGVALVTASVLLLSAAGIYALMSFTVARRTREIGIRTALGAHPRRILLGVFGRAASQLMLGVLAGSVVSSVAVASSGLAAPAAAALVAAVAVIMLVVGLLAAFAPARRGLRIQASEALRTDA